MASAVTAPGMQQSNCVPRARNPTGYLTHGGDRVSLRGPVSTISPREPQIMAKSDITGVRRKIANKVSHSNIKTKRWQFPNLQERRLFVPELGRFVRLTLSTSDLRTVDRIGLVAFAQRYGVDVSKL